MERKAASNQNFNTMTMDKLTYKYNLNNNNAIINNRLQSVDDDVYNKNAFLDDIDDQANNNYSYDEIGQLTGDISEEMTIDWNVYGKVTQINSNKGHMSYDYDATGNRIYKLSARPNAATNSNLVTVDYYFRDAQGNVLSVATSSLKVNVNQQEVAIGYATESSVEYMLYGSSRLGVLRTVNTIDPTAPNPAAAVTHDIPAAISTGHKAYELSNHLGNVLATVSDVRYHEIDGSNTLWKAVTLSAQDYYPFGMIMPKRNYNSNGNIAISNNASATATTVVAIDETYPADNSTTDWDKFGSYTADNTTAGIAIANNGYFGMEYHGIFNDIADVSTDAGDKLRLTLTIDEYTADEDCNQELYLLTSYNGNEGIVYLGTVVEGTTQYEFTSTGQDIKGIGIVTIGQENTTQGSGCQSSFTLKACKLEHIHYSYLPATSIMDATATASNITENNNADYDLSSKNPYLSRRISAV